MRRGGGGDKDGQTKLGDNHGQVVIFSIAGRYLLVTFVIGPKINKH